jgi:hypothetical protein
MQEKRSSLPLADRVGALTASALLTFALARLIQSPRLTLTIELPGFYFAYPFTINSAMALFAAALAAAGMDWLARSHPALNGRSRIEHLLIPTFTALALSAPLGRLGESPLWLAAFAASGLTLTAVFLAEYTAIDPASSSYALARSGLTALAYALFFIFAFSLRIAGARMFVLAPLVFVFAGLIALRILHMDGINRWDFPWAAGIGLICAQIASGLHYWSFTPVQFALALTGPLYALTLLSTNLTEDVPLRRAGTGPIMIVIASWVAAAFVN